MNLIFVEALIITIITEVSVGEVFVYFKDYKNYLLLIIAAGSVLTLPFVWFVFPILFESTFLYLFFSELFAVGAEALLITYLYKEIHFDTAILLSLSINVASFLIGVLIQL